MPPQPPTPAAEKAQKPDAKNALGSLVQEALAATNKEAAQIVALHEERLLKLTARGAALDKLQKLLTPELSEALYLLVQSSEGYQLVVKFIEASRAEARVKE